MRKSKRPVWVVHPEQRDPIRQVLAPLDFGETARAAIGTAELMHSLFGASCWALHCVSYPNDLSLARFPDGAARVREYHQQVNASAEQQMRDLVGAERTHWSVALGHASLTDEVERMIRDHGIDLVVLGSISRTGIRGLLTGNSAEKIFTRVDCSLWVLKPAGWESPVKFQ
jgi:nucleotide-binding universal stress UspA family protein